jgi:large subunit ribosomal protein L35
MPKMKTHKGAAKRFNVTGGGHIRYYKSNKKHLNTGKPRSRKRRLRQAGIISDSFEKNLRNLVPYK